MCNCGQCSSEDPEAFDVTREYKTVRLIFIFEGKTKNDLQLLRNFSIDG